MLVFLTMESSLDAMETRPQLTTMSSVRKMSLLVPATLI
jgi:hypothetical protein